MEAVNFRGSSVSNAHRGPLLQYPGDATSLTFPSRERGAASLDLLQSLLGPLLQNLIVSPPRSEPVLHCTGKSEPLPPEERGALSRPPNDLLEPRSFAILVFDLMNSTAFLKGLEDRGEPVTQGLNQAFEPLLESIRAHSGFAIDICGDAIVALFPKELGIWDALNAALRSQEHRDAALNSGPALPKVRAGIAYGQLVQCRLGSCEHPQVKAIGSALNLASHAATGKSSCERILSEDDDVQIFLDPSGRRALGDISSTCRRTE